MSVLTSFDKLLFLVCALCFSYCHGFDFSKANLQTPDCSELITPESGVVDVPLNTIIEWSASTDALGYRLTLGSSSGDNDILDQFDVGNLTSYQLPSGLPLLTTIFVYITSYNDKGESTGCSEFRFTTTSGAVPRCTQIINPSNGDELVPVNANITWIRDFTALGYWMTIRIKEPDGDYLLRDENVGNGTNFKPPNFEPRTKYFVTITPYNNQGSAQTCEAIVFTTGDPLPLPDCASWGFPANGSQSVQNNIIFQWNAVDDADGYLLSIGTTLNGAELLKETDVQLQTSYQLPDNLPMGATIFVKLITYEGEELSENCPIISFTVEGPNPNDFKNQVPKFFTPNNDGYNDFWAVASTDDVTVQNIFVHDRFGKLVKQLAPKQGWDGTFNGQHLPADSYWYIINFIEIPSIKGYFLLKR